MYISFVSRTETTPKQQVKLKNGDELLKNGNNSNSTSLRTLRSIPTKKGDNFDAMFK